MNRPGNTILSGSRTTKHGWRVGGTIAGILLWLAVGTGSQAAVVMPEEMQQMKNWLTEHSDPNAKSPWSFLIDGKPWTGQGITASKSIGRQRIEHETVYEDANTGLQVRCVMIAYENFPTLEWTIYFRNTGSNDTPIISDVQALDTSFQGPNNNAPMVHHWAGSQATIDDYRPYETRLGAKAEKRFASNGGRGSDGVWPYFNIDWGSKGVIAVVGWPGQWVATFARDEKAGLRVRACQEQTHFRLKPGEEVRTPLIVLQYWQGGNWIRAQNVWREWMREHNIPRLNGELPPPLFPASSANQLSEMQKANEQNQKEFINGYVSHGVNLDFWWMDAGWYGFREGWWNVGTWEVDRKRFPNGLRAVSDYAHERGIKTLLWFEPERVTPGTWLYENHPEWLLGANGQQKLLNLGNPAARQWVIEHVDKVMADEGIDIYRQDFNFPPLSYWRANDAPDRQGLTEIKHVSGYLAFWDELRRRHPGLLIDTCASGGRRNDLETLRRSVPLHKSDMEYPNLTAKQTQLYGLAFWSPYFGAPVYPAERVEAYGFRSGIAPMTGVGYDSRRDDLDFALLRRLVAEWRQAAPIILNGDYYPLTSWSAASDVWLAYQFDWPENNQGVVQAFRRPDSPYEAARLRLGGLAAAAKYELVNADEAGTNVISGRELMGTGLLVTLKHRPSSALITYRQQKEANYISRLLDIITQARTNLTTLTESASRAANEFLAGGKIWAAGRQADFISEACGRAGGLMAIAPLGQRTPASHDVVLYAVPGTLNDEDMTTLDQWQAKGATVIKFSSAAGLYKDHYPIDTVANIIDLWTWTGEFVAACTRSGRMPVLYQSYGLPGGPERGKKYQGKKFHDDISIQPIGTGVLGQQYLDKVERMLTWVNYTQGAKIHQAAQWWAQASSTTTLVTGHMFPRHAQDPRAPHLCEFTAVPAWEDKDLLDANHAPELVFNLGYQFAPQKLLEQAKVRGIKLVYTTVQPGQPAEPASNIIYIDPRWPLADGCVTVTGYDVPILPASGVVQAAIYWTMAAERNAGN